ncbi:MAG: hypothetical protein QXX88_00340 [Metallosphaera sp.]
MRLSEFIERYPLYKPYVNLLKEFMERSPEEIEVYSFEEGSRLGYEVGEGVLGFVIPPDKVFFREMPPPLHVFIHELIHLCRKPSSVHEEVYAYNLVNLVIFCVERGIRCNPFSLYTLKIEDIERVLKRYGIRSIDEYYQVEELLEVYPEIEIIRIPMIPEEIFRRIRLPERILVQTFVSELITGIPRYSEGSVKMKILTDLINITRGEE